MWTGHSMENEIILMLGKIFDGLYTDRRILAMILCNLIPPKFIFQPVN